LIITYVYMYVFPVWENNRRRQGNPCLPMPSSSRADGDGGTTAGVVLPLDLVGNGISDAYVIPSYPTQSYPVDFFSTYTVPVSIGDQQFSLQVDTGSSDLVGLSLSLL